MAKRKTRTKAKPKRQWGPPDFWINSQGLKVICKPIKRDYLEDLTENIEAKYRKRGEPLDPPTYTFDGFGGVTETRYHDEESIKQLRQKENPTDEEREVITAWDAYKEVTVRLEAEIAEVTTKALILKGVANEVPEEWIEEQKLIGNPLPTSPALRKWQWAKDQVVHNEDDIVNLFKIPIALAQPGLTEEGFQQLEKSFRGLMGNTVPESERATEGDPSANGTGHQ